jgi:hypothetical protein
MIVGAALGIVIIFALLKLRTRQRERSEEDD